METTITFGLWYQPFGGQDTLDLFHAGMAALDRALPYHEVTINSGAASIYDGVRGRSPANLRTATGSSLALRQAAIVDPNGSLSALALPVGRPPVNRANLLANGNFGSWTNGVPTGWRPTPGTALSRSGNLAIITTTGRATPVLISSIPASKPIPNAWYRMT